MPFTVGQYLTANDLKSQEDAHTLGYGVVSGLKVVPDAPASMDIDVEVGKCYAADTVVVKGAVTTLTVTAADPANPRKDIVVCNSVGTLSIVAGTPEAALPGANVGVYTLNPEPPSIPANSIILAEIWVPAGAAAITGAEIYDKRVSIADFLTHESAATGVHGVGAGTIAEVGDIAVDANLSAAGQDAITKRHTRSHDHSNALDGSPIAEAGVPNHMSKNKLAFTLNKILKGAGAGSNPTEVDMPAGEATTFEVLDGHGDVGPGAAQVAKGDHTHTLIITTERSAILRQTNETNWVEVDNIAVPATKKILVCAQAYSRASDPYGSDGYLRVLVDAVQKLQVSLVGRDGLNLGNYYGALSSYIGNGGTVTCEVKRNGQSYAPGVGGKWWMASAGF